MNAFDHMVNWAVNKTPEIILNSPILTKKISENEYEEFRKEFIFGVLQNKHFGQEFSKRFGILDSVLTLLVTEKLASEYIKIHYIK